MKSITDADTPLIIAAQNNAVSFIVALLKMPDIDVFARDEHRNSALDYAVKHDHVEIALLLEEHIREIEGAGVHFGAHKLSWMYSAIAPERKVREEVQIIKEIFSPKNFFF